MAEDRVRQLERRYKESGSERDELAYLQEQVRTGGTLDWESYSRLAELNVEAAADYLGARVERGDLEQEKLELAAYCSHEPARLVWGELPSVDAGPTPAADWVAGLAHWRKEAVVRVSVTCASRVLDLWEFAFPDDALPRAALAAAEAWAGCPCDYHQAAAEAAWVEAGTTAGRAQKQTAREAWAAGNAGYSAAYAAKAASARTLGEAVESATWSFLDAAEALEGQLPGGGKERALLMCTIRADVAYWALNAPPV